jgi:UDPglucose 6-dehydrogenase
VPTWTRCASAWARTRRIGKRFLFPGIGYGGSCFPKDVQALAKSGKDAGYDFKIISSVMQVNERQKTTLTDKIKKHYGGNVKGKRFAMWGLAFKPDTDDIREAPALYMIDALVSCWCRGLGFRSGGHGQRAQADGAKGEIRQRRIRCAHGADALIVATEWALFRTPDFERVGAALKDRIIFDGRNLYDTEEMRDLGFHYVSVGRQAVNAPNKK